MYSRKIIFLMWQDMAGGIEVLLPKIISYLPEYEFEAFVFRPLKKNKYSVFNKTNIKIHYGSNFNLLMYLKFIYFVFKNQRVLYHAFNIGPIILLILRLLLIKRVVYSIHGTVYWKSKFKKYFLKPLWYLALNKKIKFISNSYYSREVFYNNISNKVPVKVLYNPFDINKFRLKNKKVSLEKGLKIFYVGRLVSSKNLFKWIDISETILESYPNSQFFIYGTGPLEKNIRRLIEKKNLQDRIILKGFIENIEIAYHENDILLFLSKFESFGNIVVESILCGTPVLTSQIPSMNEIFKNYPEFLVPLDENLAETILHKISKYDFLLNLTHKASVEFREKFSLNNHVSKLIKIYNLNIYE